MTRTPLYTFKECIDIMRDSRLDELVALSTLLIEEWKGYTIEEQVLLLPALVKRRKELELQTPERPYRYIPSKADRSKGGDSSM